MSSAPDIDTFIKGCQFHTVAAPPPSAQHPATPLLQSLSSSRFQYSIGKTWFLYTIWGDIRRGTDIYTRYSASTAFCHDDPADLILRGFILLLTAEAAVLLFGRILCISRLASAPQNNRKYRLICNSTSPPPRGDLLLPPS